MSDEWIPMPRYKLRKHLVKAILKREELANKSCLEIGYGAGDMLLMFERMGLRVHGYDFSSIAYQSAKTRISENIRLFEDEDDIEKNAYDYLMAFEVLEHIQEDEMALKQFGRYLRENGRIMLSVPAHMSKWGNSDIGAGHYRRYGKDELKTKLKTANFKPIFLWSYGYPLSLALDRMLNKSFYGQNVEAKKKMQREALSKESGVKRKKTILNKISSSDILLFPFYILQNFFLNTDLGSGYIVYAEKVK
jgi:ubiquinone/menaquinone biosynthesis C-methylase UbiE